MPDATDELHDTPPETAATSGMAAPAGGVARTASTGRLKLVMRFEDLVLAGWVAIVSPLIFRVGGDKGPFDAGQPLQGMIRLLAVAGVLLCVAARPPLGARGTDRSFLNSGAVGPFSGGVLLVAISGFTALGTPSSVVLGAVIVLGIAMVAVRVAVPPLPITVRRVLVSPFIAVAAGIYWNLIAAVTAGHTFEVTPAQIAADPHTAELILGFLAAFSAVYYAMLVYGPRQVAEREGGRVEWILRYAVFFASVVLGIGWLGVLGT
jgi:hypothetical protein